MSFAGAVKRPINLGKKKQGNSVEKGIHSGEGTDSLSTGRKRKRNDSTFIHQNMKDKKKANDLRFESVGATDPAVSRRKERKKQRLEARKNKNKRPRAEDAEFPGREEIKFGDIVQAPPKLLVPKAFEPVHDASQERLRLQAIGWTSRPGVQLRPPFTTSSLV